jgi:hypothetical protein
MLLKVNSVYHLLRWSDFKTYLAESSKVKVHQGSISLKRKFKGGRKMSFLWSLIIGWLAGMIIGRDTPFGIVR